MIRALATLLLSSIARTHGQMLELEDFTCGSYPLKVEFLSFDCGHEYCSSGDIVNVSTAISYQDVTDAEYVHMAAQIIDKYGVKQTLIENSVIDLWGCNSYTTNSSSYSSSSHISCTAYNALYENEFSVDDSGFLNWNETDYTGETYYAHVTFYDEFTGWLGDCSAAIVFPEEEESSSDVYSVNGSSSYQTAYAAVALVLGLLFLGGLFSYSSKSKQTEEIELKEKKVEFLEEVVEKIMDRKSSFNFMKKDTSNDEALEGEEIGRSRSSFKFKETLPWPKSRKQKIAIDTSELL